MKTLQTRYSMSETYNPSIPTRIADIAQLEDFMSESSTDLMNELSRLAGDLMILGTGGKMGPSLARMANRYATLDVLLGVVEAGA